MWSGALKALGMIALGCLVAGGVVSVIMLALHPTVAREREGACAERVVQQGAQR